MPKIVISHSDACTDRTVWSSEKCNTYKHRVLDLQHLDPDQNITGTEIKFTKSGQW